MHIMTMQKVFAASSPNRRCPLPVHGDGPLPASRYSISGTTKDSSGSALGNCAIELFFTRTDAIAQRTTSDGSGAYQFIVGPGDYYYAVAYLAGSPDVAGTTVNTLQGAGSA